MPTITTIPSGTKGADFTGATPAIDAWLDAQHAKFVVRYIAGGGSWKHITPAEIAHHHARGIAVVLNYEGSMWDYTGGAAKGTTNGTSARKVAQALGYPTGLALVVSVDTGLTAGQLPLARAYVEAFFAAARPYAPALYGPVNLYHQVDHHAPLFWLPNASSWQVGLKPADKVHVRQHHSLHPPGVDPNTAVLPFAAWLPTPDPPPVPSPIDPAIGASGEAMLYCYIDANGTVWIGNGLARIALDDINVFNEYVRLSTTNGGPSLISGQGVAVRSVNDVSHVGGVTIEALGRAI